MGGSGEPIPTPDFIANNFNLYIQPFFQNFTPQALFTPEGNYGLYTGVKSLTLDMSQAQGVQILDATILQQVGLGNTLVVKGESQSSTISSMVMPLLAAQGVPTNAVSFVLTGDPNAPNGGLFERLVGLRIPALGITFNGATPDNLYPTTIWTQEYDGFADVPRYPINLLSDINSLAGIYYVHPTSGDLSHAQVGTAIQLPTTGPTMTTYEMIPTEHLPLLQPLRSIPLVGTPFADLLEPDLRVIVNLGYGDPNYGWSTAPANVPTPFGLFPSLNDMEKVPDLLASGTQQGITAFTHDVSAAMS
ncbi:PE-PPE domain-containing protein, partial [Mycobacterium sp.]|uniref:PE-PPE domain-containing protein n=1 Tax=Mycobacterium sp. TaxID=1785 RepID=UPI003C7954C3